AAPKFTELTDGPGVTLEQLKGYYHRIGAAPWQVDWVSRSGNFPNMDDALFKYLNPKKPDELSRELLKDLPRLLAKLDVDRDEMITAVELSPEGYQGGFAGQKPFDAKSGPFFLLDPTERGRTLLAAAMLSRYDRDKDGKLSREEIAFDADL